MFKKSPKKQKGNYPSPPLKGLGGLSDPDNDASKDAPMTFGKKKKKSVFGK